MPRLANVDRESALSCTEAGQFVAEVACVSRCNRQTLHNMKTHVRHIGSVADRPRSWALRVTSRAEDYATCVNYVRLQHPPMSKSLEEV